MRNEESIVDYAAAATTVGTAPKGTKPVVNAGSTGLIQDKDNFIADQGSARPADRGVAATFPTNNCG